MTSYNSVIAVWFPFLTLTPFDPRLFKTLRQVLAKVTSLENAFDGTIPSRLPPCWVPSANHRASSGL